MNKKMLPTLCFVLCFLLFHLSDASETRTYTPTTAPKTYYQPPVHRSLTPAKPSSDAYKYLAPQNAARAVLGLPPLAWDNRLAAYARGYAGRRRSDCALIHSNGPYGENIFWGSGSDWTPAQAVAAWVAERRWYKYYSNSCTYGQDCGHYTQIIWKNTRRVGCARVICYGGLGVFVTCNYDPPGNYIGSRPY